jgi:hypothetical protein
MPIPDDVFQALERGLDEYGTYLGEYAAKDLDEADLADANLRHQAAWEWLQKQRPDVIEDFDPMTWTENGQRSYHRRVDVGRRASAMADDNDDETNASDVIGDILTFVCGPAGTYSFREGEVSKLHERIEAISNASALLDRAMRSWQGDAEDYCWEES